VLVSGPIGGLTVTHPTEDGDLAHFPRAKVVALSAALRRSGLSCVLSIEPGTPDTWTPGPYAKRVDGLPAVLTVTYHRGVIRLRACAPTAKGSLGSVVDVLPVEGLAARPLPKPTHAATRVLSLATLSRHVYRAHGEAAKVYPRLTAEEWTAREIEAMRILGSDLERVQAA
jgi:hypothetical protein